AASSRRMYALRTSPAAIGGEEFTLILPDATPEQPMRRVDELRVGLSAMRVESRGESLASVTASFGVAGFPLHGATAEGMLAAADKALYRAKAEGRNRVVVAEPP